MAAKPTDVWRALADANRRKILDLLRDEPRTTSQLSACFDMTRYGVMKHLAVLQGAGLVTVRRRGRERWNHLNAVPLQRIHRRWVGRYAGAWSANLLELGAFVEGRVAETEPGEGRQGRQGRRREVPGAEGVESAEGETDMTRTLEGLDSFHIAQDVIIAAPRDAVWRALTRDIAAWWAFRLTDDDARLTLDARVGGHFIEQSESGKGAVWGTISDLRPGELLRLSGPLGMRSRPVNSVYSYTLSDHEDGTLVELDHRCFGDLDPEWAPSHEEGWKRILGICLKRYLEDGMTRDDLAAEERDSQRSGELRPSQSNEARRQQGARPAK